MVCGWLAEAMQNTLGGIVIGVLSDMLLRRSVMREARSALADGRLLLVSPCHPEAGFTVGKAMGRNKLIYTLADFGLVVSAEHKKGGSWEGAIEALKRKPGRPVFVRMSDRVPLGNRKLVDLGGVPFPGRFSEESPANLFEKAAVGKTQKSVEDSDLFSYRQGGDSEIRKG